MMKKILYFILTAIGIFIAVFAGAGFVSKPEWSGSVTQVYDAPTDSIWYLLKDTYRYNSERHEVSETKILIDSVSYRKWREHTNLFGDMLLETAREIPFQLFETRMTESGFGMKGIWTFTLQAVGKQTKITITENSVTKGFIMRSILALVGRNGNLHLQTKALERHIKKMNCIN